MLNLLNNQITKFDEIQELLRMTFEAEKKYFETAERVQIAVFSRFLYYQSSMRNKLCNRLIQALVENKVEPEMTYTDKLKREISGLEMKRMLEDKEYTDHVGQCIAFDTKLINKCNQIGENKELPVSVLEAIIGELSFLTLAKTEAINLINSQQLKVEEPKIKIIPLKSKIS